MNTEVTILIVTHSSLPSLKAAIDSIVKAKTKIGYKMLVVDNGSTSDTTNYLKSKGIAYLKNSRNVGYIKAQAQAFRKIDTPYFCSCNDDIVVTNLWLDKLLSKLKSDNKIKIVAPVKWGSRTRHPYDNIHSSREVWEKIKTAYLNDFSDKISIIKKFTHGKSLEEFGHDFKIENHLEDVEVESPPDFVPGFCFLTETDIWKKLGGFVNLKMKNYGTEDVERCWRLGLAGYKIIRTGDVYVHHFEGASVTKNKINTGPMIVNNNRILLKKYGKYYWLWLNKELKNKSIETIIKEHWMVEKLLQNCQIDDVPDKIASLE